MEEYKENNEERAAAIETFLVEEAHREGVIRVLKHRAYKNPNRLEKILAPWFNEVCLKAKAEYKQMKR